MKKIVFLFALSVFCGVASAQVEIVDGRLTVDGREFYIKGVGGTNRLDIAAANGANAFRTWGGSVDRAKADLARARELGMYVMQGIGLPKDSLRYHDREFRAATLASVRELATALKDEPQLLVWGIGNEIDHGTANTPTAWKFVNELALAIKAIDPSRLTSAVITHNRSALDMIARYAPDLDVVGINSYGSIGEVDEIVRASAYKGSYIVTEWGPTGWWETTETAWGAPLEQSSEEKRAIYETRYGYISGDPRCLGSFVFLWGQKEERTPTWFSMFVENDVPGLPLRGQKTPMVEAMERVWRGAEPSSTAPVVRSVTVDGVLASGSPRVAAGTSFEASVDVSDREKGRLRYVWEVLREATITATGGAYEPRPERVGQVVEGRRPVLRMALDEPGNYRIYVYVLDNQGFVSTANVPFQVAAAAESRATQKTSSRAAQ